MNSISDDELNGGVNDWMFDDGGVDICPECRQEICKCPDFAVRNEGSVWTFTPLTEAAYAFFDRCAIEPWQMLGPSLVVDHRPGNALLQAILEEGLTAEGIR